jgi:hypothetical protein
MAGYSRQSLFEIAEAERLLGYDEDAEVYRCGGRVFRRIRSGSAEYYRRILHALEQTDSLSKEIVATQECRLCLRTRLSSISLFSISLKNTI